MLTNERKTSAASKAELQQLAETLAVFQELPQMERIAIQYYIKGRVDANSAHIEIPAVGTAKSKTVGV